MDSKNSLIKFARPSTTSDYSYLNQFDSCSFDQINLLNLTQYDPTKATPLFIDIDIDWSSISISNINIKDVDALRGQTSIFGLKTYGSITITNGTIQNINTNAYSYDTTDFSYVPSVGGVFIFTSIQSNSTYPDSIYSFSNLKFDKIYGRKGGSFYFGTSSQVTTAHNNYVSMNSITIQNSFSYESGAITFNSGKQFVTISKSNFTSNLGINCEADIRLITCGSLIISDSIFKLFSSSNLNSGQSITLEMNTPFAFKVKVANIIVKWSDFLYDQNAYISYINATNSQLNSIMVLSLDLIIIKNYKIMAPVGFEPGSVCIVYVLPDIVCQYANIVSLYSQKVELMEVLWNIHFAKTKIYSRSTEGSNGFSSWSHYYSTME